MPRTKSPLRAPRLDFPVTAEMIADAVPQDSSHCMIADGLKAAMPHARSVAVDLATIRYTDKDTGYRYVHLTARPAQVALLDFDHAVVPEPFRVQSSAVQIIPPKRGTEKSSTALSKSRKRTKAKLVKNTAGGRNTPIKVGGKAPPMGPAARGKGSKGDGRPDSRLRVGARRQFGLRAMGQ